MLAPPGNARVFLYQHPTSMRKSFEGLCSAVEAAFPGELLTGAYFVFLNRYKDHMKVLYWDSDGFAIWYKRLEKGTFASKEKHSTPMERREFLMLLEGIEPKRCRQKFIMK